jgi:Rad3-related DNA helicase
LNFGSTSEFNAKKERTFAEFLPLDIKPQFEEVLSKSISVLFTGGTMEPKGYLKVLATPKVA